MQALLIFPLLSIEGEHQNEWWPALKCSQVRAERYAPSDLPIISVGSEPQIETWRPNHLSDKPVKKNQFELLLIITE